MNKKLLTAALAAVTATCVGLGIAAKPQTKVFASVFASEDYKTYMTSPADNGIRLWTHEMSNFDPTDNYAMQAADGVFVSAENIAVGQFTSKVKNSETLRTSPFNDLTYEYTMNATGFTKNNKGNYAPQVCYNNQAVTATSNPRPMSLSYMVNDIAANATAVFGSQAQSFDYFELSAYVDMSADKTSASLDAIKQFVGFEVSADGANWTKLGQDAFSVRQLASVYLTNEGFQDSSYAILYPMTYPQRVQAADSAAGTVTRIRFANNDKLTGAKFVKIVLDSQKIKLDADADADRLEGKGANEHLLLDNLSVFVNGLPMNLTYNTNWDSAWRSDVYGGGTPDLASDSEKVWGRVASDGIVYDSKKWAGANEGELSYYVFHGAKPTKAGATQIFHIANDVAGFQTEIIGFSGNSPASNIKMLAAADNTNETAWTEMNYITVKGGNYLSGQTCWLLNTNTVPTGTRYIKLVINPGDGGSLKAYEPMYLQARVFDKINYGVIVSGENSVAKNTDLTLKAKLTPELGVAPEFVWSIVTEKTTAAGAEINNGVFKATGNGVAYVTASASGATSEEFMITVGNSVQSIALSTVTAGTLYQGKEIIIGAEYKPLVELSNVSWEVVEGTGTIAEKAYEGREGFVYAALTAESESVTVKVTITADGQETIQTYTVSDITEVVSVETVDVITQTAYTNLPTTIDYMVLPEDATLAGISAGFTSFEIVEDGGTQATLDNFGILKTKASGTVKIKVTVDGKECVKEITVKAFDLGEKVTSYNIGATVNPDESATSGLISAKGNWVVETNKIYNEADKKSYAQRSLKIGNSESNLHDRAYLTFYEENGFNSFAFMTVMLNDNKSLSTLPEAYRKQFDGTSFKAEYSFDGETYYETQWSGAYIDGFLFKGDAKGVWPIFCLYNNAPISDNPHYLRISMAPMRVQYEFMPLFFNDHMVGEGETAVEANTYDTLAMYGNKPTAGNTLEVIPADENLSVGNKTALSLGNINYKEDKLAFAVTKNGQATTAASVTDKMFSASEAGDYTVTATLDLGEGVVATGNITITVSAPSASAVTINGTKDVYFNGDNFAYTIVALDQFDNEYVPQNLTWTITQVSKNDGSKDFATVSGSSLTVTNAVQVDFYGTLKLVVTVDGKTDERTITVNKKSRITEITISGDTEINAGAKLQLNVVIKDQFGLAMTAADLASVNWSVTGTGLKAASGADFTVVYDLNGNTFSGELKVVFKARVNDLDDYTVKNLTVNVKEAQKPAGGTDCNSSLDAQYPIILIAAVAFIAIARKRRVNR